MTDPDSTVPPLRRTRENGSAGWITASPNPLAAGEAALTLEWEASNAGAEIYVSEEGESEKLLARGGKNSLTLDWIRPGARYVFRLYAGGEPRVLIDEVTVTRQVEGTLTIEEETDAPAFSGAVSLRWELTEPVTGELILKEPGVTDKVVLRGPSGSSIVRGLKHGVEYLFQLYAATFDRPLLAETKFFRPISGKISATPNPIPLGGGSQTTLLWQISPPATGEIRLSGDHDEEKIVCRGASGSFEVKGLRVGIDYLFRLYDQEEPGAVLDEVAVRVEQIVWGDLLERLENTDRAAAYSDELAKFIAAVLPGLLRQKDFPRWFLEWEASGFHVTPVHFYEPIPDSRTLPDSLWSEPLALSGVDMNGARQFALLTKIFPEFRAEYLAIPTAAPTEGGSFYVPNGRFDGLDPLLAYCMVRHYRPSQIIEVGSGFSTLLLAQAALKNGATELHSIEPYPEEFLTRGVAGLTSLRVQRVEDVELAVFETLSPNDILFIDSSHVVRIGGDVNHLYLKVLPRLKPGVLVHVHDIFLPYEYPQEWVVGRRRFWTEQYLLQAFLVCNSEFEVLVGSGYLKAHFPEELAVIFPHARPWQGGSFWMRRRPAAV